MKVCKVCNKVAPYPHYASKDGTITCEKCTIKKEIESSNPDIIEKIKTIDTWDKLHLITDIVDLMSKLNDQDIDTINYILKNVKERY